MFLILQYWPILYTDQIPVPTNIKVIKLACLNLVVVQCSV